MGSRGGAGGATGFVGRHSETHPGADIVNLDGRVKSHVRATEFTPVVTIISPKVMG